MRRFLALALLLAPASLAAQVLGDSTSAVLVSAGGEWDRYLRLLQARGLATPHPWSVRHFGAADVRRLAPADSGHPWDARLRRRTATARVQVARLTPEVQLVYNSTLPFGYNDGAVWAGRGLTTALSGGVAGRVGPLSFSLAPVLFRAENAPFPLLPNGLAGTAAFRDPFSSGIDLPQRFGHRPYQRLDPGQSTVRLDVAGLAVGASTANQYWGPAVEHPILLGNNAPGYPHLFVGTSRPLDLWIGRVHGRMVWGELSQSSYSPADTRSARRFTSGIVAVFIPRGAPGLELGGARFFHQTWGVHGPSREDFLRPLTGLLKSSRATAANPSGDEPDNQLASIFFRWVFPANGVELYGEYGREDHNQNGRDLALEPDHDAAYLLGIQRVWLPTRARMLVIRAEVLNARITHLQMVRPESPWYVHSPLVQGHTQRGQVLGSAGGYGGGAAVLAVERYTPTGRWSLGWTRLMRNERRAGSALLPQPELADVQHVLGVERLAYLGRIDLVVGLALVDELNRGSPRRDVGNVRLVVGAYPHW